MKRKGVTFLGKMPELREPYLIASFAGWLDAGQVATGSMTHMIRTWRAKRFVEIKSEDYCLFTSLRPEVVIDEGLVSYLRFPRSTFFWHRSKTGKHDLIFFRGVEPDLYPQKYVDTVLDIAEAFNVSRVYSIGGFYDQIPHTRPPKISGIVSKPELSRFLIQKNVIPLTYEGPASIHSFLLAACQARLMEAVSLLAHVPFYLKVETNPSVCLSLLQKLLDIIELKIDLSELHDSAISLKEALDQLLSENEELRSYVREMEEQYDRDGMTSQDMVKGADKIIKEVEAFLRKERRRGGPSQA